MKQRQILIAVVWMLIGTPSYAESDAVSPQAIDAHTVSNADVTTVPRYRLPPSNNRSLYFLPGSADLTESARLAIAEAVAHLKAIPALSISLKSYTDASEDHEYGPELRKLRATAVAGTLVAQGIPLQRILIEDSQDGEQQRTASCTSEYCRQGYRRVSVDFVRLARK